MTASRIRPLLATAAMSLAIGLSATAPAGAADNAATDANGKKYCELPNAEGGSNSVAHGQKITVQDPDGDGPGVAYDMWCNDGRWDTKEPERKRPLSFRAVAYSGGASTATFGP